MNGTSVRIRQRLDAELRFFGQWLRKPGAVGSIVPSGKVLARAMAAWAPLDSDLPVLELGPGTGPVTAAMLARGIAPERIVSVEHSADFLAYLTARFPGVDFVQGDAFDLATTLAGRPRTQFCAVISALPLLNFPKPLRTRLIADCLARVAPGAPVVQLCYGPRAPVPALKGVYSAVPTEWIVKNVPPARLFVYRALASG
ncbi:MAG: SAM-dependent methyltransferase [Alphaproteobacteria bacterium]|nr:MAG: SAM-dependent methyltransferase [Alphaproteobacteria bacterium]